MTDFDVVLRALRSAAVAKAEITTDDVWPLLPAAPAERNVIGKAFAEANRIGLIRGTERFVKSGRPEAKGRRVQVWQSLVREQ